MNCLKTTLPVTGLVVSVFHMKKCLKQFFIDELAKLIRHILKMTQYNMKVRKKLYIHSVPKSRFVEHNVKYHGKSDKHENLD